MSLIKKINFWLAWPDRALARGAIKLINIYQSTISPDHSEMGKAEVFRGCKFYPSCSVYAVGVLEKKGFVFGAPKVFWRLLRCNPWSQGGVDNF